MYACVNYKIVHFIYNEIDGCYIKLFKNFLVINSVDLLLNLLVNVVVLLITQNFNNGNNSFESTETE